MRKWILFIDLCMCLCIALAIDTLVYMEDGMLVRLIAAIIK